MSIDIVASARGWNEVEWVVGSELDRRCHFGFSSEAAKTLGSSSRFKR
jgi:hypothetical protein